MEKFGQLDTLHFIFNSIVIASSLELREIILQSFLKRKLKFSLFKIFKIGRKSEINIQQKKETKFPCIFFCGQKITNLRGKELSLWRRLFSRSGTGTQSKVNLASKPPYVISEPVRYSNELSEITSIIGHGIAFLVNLTFNFFFEN